VDNIIVDSQATMRRIGKQLLYESRRKIAEGKSADSTALRDLLSLLVRANMAKDISDAQRLSEEDVLARTSSSWVTYHSVEVKIQRYRHSSWQGMKRMSALYIYTSPS
jgi:hypothetical protein